MNDKLNKEIKENDNELTAVKSNKEEAVVEEVTIEDVILVTFKLVASIVPKVTLSEEPNWAELEINVLAVILSLVATRVLNEALTAVNEPEILEAICAELDTNVKPNAFSDVVDKLPDISDAIWAELDISVFPNSVSAVVTLVEKLELAAVNEPLMLEAIWAELDNAPMKIPLKSFAVMVALELIFPLAVISFPTNILFVVVISVGV